MSAQPPRRAQGRLRQSPQLELISHLAPEILAVLRSDQFRPWRESADFYVARDVSLLGDSLLERPGAGALTSEERRALDGECAPLPDLPVTYEEYQLDDPEAPSPITAKQRVGGGEGFSVSIALAAERPALIVNWSTMDWLLPEDEPSPGGGGGALLLFASLADRNDHLEQLWRRHEA
jgi:hypothetical protein